jgi:hypothetical protein
MDNGKEEEVKKDGGKEGHHLKEGEGDEVTDVDQKGSQRGEEKGEKGSNEAERDDEKTYPWDE